MTNTDADAGPPDKGNCRWLDHNETRNFDSAVKAQLDEVNIEYRRGDAGK
jgi:hypothetical protein